MSKNPYPNIHKSKLDLTIDLFHSLRIVKDSLEMMKKGHFYQLSIIYTQLRILLTDKSSKGVTPLLALVSDYFNGDLNFYYKKTVPILEGVDFEYMNHELSLEKKSDKHIKGHINDYLNETALIVEGHQIKVKELIGHLANSYGGAHYSSKFPEYLLKLKFFKIGEHTIFDNYILQLAELCLEIGVNVLKKITDFNIYFFIYMPKNELDIEESVFDFKHIKTSNRVTLSIKRNKYCFSLVDSLGRHFNKATKDSFISNQHHLLSISHKITSNLESNFKLSINNSLQINQTEKNPFLFINMLVHFDRYINKYYNRENVNLEFGFVYYGYSSKEISEEKNNDNYNKIMNTVDTKAAVWLEKGVFGFCKSGDTELKIEGGKNINIKEYLKNRKT